MRFSRLAVPLSLVLLLVVALMVVAPGDPTVEAGQAQGPTATPVVTPSRVTPPTAAQVAESRAILERPLDPAHLFDDLTEVARDMAGMAYVPPASSLPRSLTELTYEEYRSIEFRSGAAVWRGVSPFEIQLFHPGFLYTSPVRFHVVEDDRISDLPFDPGLFDYGAAAARFEETARALKDDPGYGGFRIHYPLNGGTSKDEVAVFLGASYFRLLGPGQAHGLSSRGIAVNVAEEGGEEFPAFREFWLVRPAGNAGTMIFFGLLDGPSITGVYRLELEPADRTTLVVQARIFARRDIAKLGVAPLTSMFLYGPNGARLFDDYRPQVHDSDGLSMLTSWGEWIWRPLSNRRDIQITSLRDENPRGFGLAQRDRSFESYLDLEAQYHRRPSEWVAIDDDWGAGGVELVELATASEFNDNVVASWVPDEPFRAGDERTYRYRLVTFDGHLEEESIAQVERTRIGRDALPGQANAAPSSQRRFVVDFSGGELSSLTLADTVGALLVTSSGEASEPVVQPLPDATGYRATFTLRPAGEEPADLRLFLELPEHRVSETWSYLWIPEQDD